MCTRFRRTKCEFDCSFPAPAEPENPAPELGSIDEWHNGDPVAVDSDRDAWDACGMRFYPSWAVIAPDGELSQRQAGAVTAGAEEAIQHALGSS